ncbi:MAG: DUF72 domain-containing protein [Thermoproteales archaeon]|nr:DUF72 domain-containing protein [Thermoproteales archaeon]
MFSPLYGTACRILLGTSGWSYDDWVGVFYTSEKGMFRQYTRVFNVVEVNSTFYKWPSIQFIKSLTKASPRNFVFTFKLPKDVTHKKMLNPEKGLENDIRRFLKLLEPLRNEGKQGPILVQLPPEGKEAFPWFEKSLNILASFEEARFTVEFRDLSWLEEDTWNMLEENNIAYCIVDEPLLPPSPVITADFAYIRWHGRGNRPWYYYLYSIEELKGWVPRIREIAGKVKEIYGFFNNHFRGFAPRNALQMIVLLGLATPRQKKILRELETIYKERMIERVKEKYIKLENATLEELLELMSGRKRLERAKNIDASNLRIKDEGEQIKGKVKEYVILIDLKRKILLHNCPDWEKSVETKRFCKHVASVFLHLPPERSLKILRSIIENIEEWEFLVGKMIRE